MRRLLVPLLEREGRSTGRSVPLPDRLLLWLFLFMSEVLRPGRLGRLSVSDFSFVELVLDGLESHRHDPALLLEPVLPALTWE